MFGTVTGNITAIAFFISFQMIGVLFSEMLLYKEKPLRRLVIGSVIGSFLLMWMPCITSLFIGFTKTSNILSLVLTTIIFIVVILIINKYKPSKVRKPIIISLLDLKASTVLSFFIENAVTIIMFIVFMVFFGMLLSSHVIRMTENGLMAGQCTYGDMNMHLGFITSIANQGKFPPDYSILPGQKLCYPFLCDTVSSSLYIWGASLRMSYILPMMFAFFQVIAGLYMFTFQWVKSKAKSILTCVLFLLNGGFGFLYFINVIGDKTHSISEIFTEFYHTPTNFVENNIRWVNTIADMLLPQRATLFGWSILFTILYLLFRANYEGKKDYFYIAGVLSGGLVMIHTHSFLALGIVCAVWLFFRLLNYCKNLNLDNNSIYSSDNNSSGAIDEDNSSVVYGISKKYFIGRAVFVFIALLLMSLFRIYDKSEATGKTAIWLYIGLSGVIVYTIFIITMLLKVYKTGKLKEILATWGVFLIIVLPIALAQLFGWTFQQATGDGFVRGHFNWANVDSGYIIFYLKNIGLMMPIIIAALLVIKDKYFRLACCGLAIWFIAEFMEFQPNDYDNNKLLYVGYIFLLIPAVSLMVDLYKKIKPKAAAIILAVIVIAVCTASGVLTLGREYVSEYQLYSKDYCEAVNYINESTIPADAVILTANNHNNAVASLTGRNIVVGSSSFLYFHGFNTMEREADVKNMFECPKDNEELFKKYNVDYILIGSTEMMTYKVDYEWFDDNCQQIYQNNGIVIYEYK